MPFLHFYGYISGSVANISGHSGEERIHNGNRQVIDITSRRPPTNVCPGLLLAMVATFLIAALPARGGEEDLYVELLRRYDMASVELQNLLTEIDRPAALPEYPRRVLSVRKNASVTIGGEMRATYIGSRASFVEPDAGNHLRGERIRDKSKIGSLGIATANLSVDFRASPRWRARFDINLKGYHGINRIAQVTNPNAPGSINPTTTYDRRHAIDNIDAAFIEYLKGGHSGFGVKVGIMKLPFGLAAKPDLIGKSFMDSPDLTGSYLMSPMNWDNAVRLPHASRLLDPAVAAMLSYEMRDIIRFEAAVFQERNRRHEFDYEEHGARHYRSESNLPQSWQVGLSLLPLEGWELSMQFRNRHSRSRGVNYWSDSPYRWDFRRNLASGRNDPRWDPVAGQWSDTGTGAGFGARHNEQAFIVGLAVEIPNTNLSVQAEYAHGWNQGFNKYLNSDGVNLGFSYRVTPFLTLHLQGEWLHLKDRSWMAETSDGWTRDRRNNRLYRLLLGAEYELHRGITLEGGWQYEYWNMTSAQGGVGGSRDERVNTANMVYMGTRVLF